MREKTTQLGSVFNDLGKQMRLITKEAAEKKAGGTAKMRMGNYSACKERSGQPALMTRLTDGMAGNQPQLLGRLRLTYNVLKRSFYPPDLCTPACNWMTSLQVSRKTNQLKRANVAQWFLDAKVATPPRFDLGKARTDKVKKLLRCIKNCFEAVLYGGFGVMSPQVSGNK